jgi:CRISPR-associated endonuclease/helicase Cas3
VNFSDFDTFFEALHGFPPFPWQRRLMRRVAEEGWPAVLGLPTSAGKTAALDIALFHIVLDADKPPPEKRAPRRIFFIVDRRLIVDEAYDRACLIRNRLSQVLGNDHEILAEAARRLLSLSSEEAAAPVDVIRLRGGLPRERAFLRNPLQPAIVLSTVDQVGSRLLFRGYGVSEFMRPIQAALVGVDSLIIIDEAHLSGPFVETLQWVRRYQSEAWADRIIGRPATVVQMTATPPADAGDIFTLDGEDWHHKLLEARLKCAKPAKIVTVNDSKEEPQATQTALVESLASNAKTLMAAMRETFGAPVVGIVANRVGTARQVFEQLSCEDGADGVLLTGRIRSFERDELLKMYLPRMKAARAPDANPRPLYVVATQTIEVGADLDFDALVTEAAALDALRQRFGRLNRLGTRDGSCGVIVYVKSGSADGADPIYGDALTETCKWMEKVAVKRKGKKAIRGQRILDFGIQAMHRVLPSSNKLARLLTPTRQAPVLMPAHVDMLVQTSPSPSVEPEVSAYLHGIESQPEDVQIIWRADLPDTLEQDEEESVIDTVVTLPPIQLEAVAVPVWAARAFLSGSLREDIADVEGGAGARDGQMRGRHTRYAVRWRGLDGSRVIHSDDARPGDTLVVPASYGGYDCFGWNPGCDQPVRDIADYVALQQRGKHVLRVHRDLISQWFHAGNNSEAVPEIIKVLQNALVRSEQDDLSEVCDDLIELLVEIPYLKTEIRETLIALRRNRRELVYPTDEKHQGILLQERRNVPLEFTDEDDASSLTREVLLESHCKHVGGLAQRFAGNLGLAEETVKDVWLAAKLHDLGKADPRFQAWLRGGDRIVARQAGTLLAKSDRMTANDRFAIRAARVQAGYPNGGRHECYSSAIAMSNSDVLNDAHDRDLVLYLIGVHHGRGRPFMPAVKDEGIKHLAFEFDGTRVEFSGSHRLEQLDQGWAERFWKLIRRYGYWGLAYLETIVRLADHRCSEQGE